MRLPPLFEAPVLQCQAQFFTAADAELGEDVLQMGFDGFVGYAQGFSNFVISAPQASQRSDLLFAFRQGIPTGFQFIGFEILIPTSAGKVHPDFFFGAALLLRGFLNSNQQFLIRVESTRIGFFLLLQECLSLLPAKNYGLLKRSHLI